MNNRSSSILQRNSSSVHTKRGLHYPTSQPSSLFVAPTGPADETLPPILSSNINKSPLNQVIKSIVPPQSNLRNSAANFSSSSFQQRSEIQVYNNELNPNNMNAINSATYMFYTFVIVFFLILTCNFYRK